MKASGPNLGPSGVSSSVIVPARHSMLAPWEGRCAYGPVLAEARHRAIDDLGVERGESIRSRV